ncbi:unnamed protein product [Cuscuta europaea]|uniref:Uncharacterized protein n=1 Tax=Cuscuta europaea TaxID=41803 RepID=A0A9P0ZG43_CUSEU|nr:unnamed protein product [Cuscuta europaea]
MKKIIRVIKENMLKLVSHESYTRARSTIRPFLNAQISASVHSGQTRCSPRSFFGVEDFVDDDNSWPYTYQKRKNSKNPGKHISFKQRACAFMEPFTLDVFISKRFVSASITHSHLQAGHGRRYKFKGYKSNAEIKERHTRVFVRWLDFG